MSAKAEVSAEFGGTTTIFDKKQDGSKGEQIAKRSVDVKSNFDVELLTLARF